MSLIAAQSLPADPLAALRELTRSEAELDALRQRVVASARTAGASWEQIGEALGISRQSAWEHYSARTREAIASTAAHSWLSEDEATDLAVEEVRAVRRQRRSA